MDGWPQVTKQKKIYKLSSKFLKWCQKETAGFRQVFTHLGYWQVDLNDIVNMTVTYLYCFT